MTDVVMPQLGETVTEGTITRWFKQPGDEIAIDEVLFEVSTDKVDSEVPSPAAGILQSIAIPEGETVDVGTVLAVIGGDAAPAAAAPAPAAAAPAPAPEPAPAPPPAPEPAPAPTPPPAPAPPAPAPAPAPVVAAAPPPAPAAPAASAPSGVLLSPVVRKLVNEHGLDVAQITGTGLGGRITRSDVEKVIQAGGSAAPRSGCPCSCSCSGCSRPCSSGSCARPSGSCCSRPCSSRCGTGGTGSDGWCA